MAALPAWMDARLGTSYHDGDRLVVPMYVTVHRRSFGFARIVWQEGRQAVPAVPRWRLALATARICLRPTGGRNGRSAAT